MKRYGYRNGIALLEAAGAFRVFCSPPLPVSHNLGTCRMSADRGRRRDRPLGPEPRGPQPLRLRRQPVHVFVWRAIPTLTIVALALRQAGHIARQMSRGDL